MNNREALFNLEAMVEGWGKLLDPDNDLDSQVQFADQLVSVGKKAQKLRRATLDEEISPHLRSWLGELLKDPGTCSAFGDKFPYARIRAGLQGEPAPPLSEWEDEEAFQKFREEFEEDFGSLT